MAMTDTPETDSIIRNAQTADHPPTRLAATLTVKCGKLERERDEALAQVKELIYIAERAIALAEIDFENDKFGVVSELRDGLEKIKEEIK